MSDLFNEVEMPLAAGAGADGAGRRAPSTAIARRHERRVRRQLWPTWRRGSTRWSATRSTSGRRSSSSRSCFNELALPATKRTRTGYSTDASVLEELQRASTRWWRLILEHRQVSKLKSHLRRRAAGPGGRDGRLHTTYQQAVAATGRLSSIDPEPAEHPDPLGARPPHPARLRGAAGQAAARRRLLAAGAAHPGPRLRRRRTEGRLRGPLGHPPRRRGPRPGPAAGGGRPARAQRGEDDQLRHRLRAVATSGWRIG